MATFFLKCNECETKFNFHFINYKLKAIFGDKKELKKFYKIIRLVEKFKSIETGNR